MKQYSTDAYIELLSRFVDGQMPAAEFCERYVKLHKDDAAIRAERVFLLLDRLFADADAYPDDAELVGGTQELRSHAAEALASLKQGLS